MEKYCVVGVYVEFLDDLHQHVNFPSESVIGNNARRGCQIISLSRKCCERAHFLLQIFFIIDSSVEDLFQCATPRPESIIDSSVEDLFQCATPRPESIIDFSVEDLFQCATPRPESIIHSSVEDLFQCATPRPESIILFRQQFVLLLIA
ncbi:hypothetical protein DPMN_117726 [Dreissena polymorpha]|uniref:Uncharacterized protein n=1 Tax=Dreissena polymorpha TaxID=45954 RepID=A0A9D4JMW1_DREPO|nr:hypothetical protein DPMN_117726 [Dreissena polymorpha]